MIQGRKYLQQTAALLAGLALLCTATAGLASGIPQAENTWNGPKPKYVFMLIADGLGLQQVASAEAFLASQRGNAAPGIVKLDLSQLPEQGLSTTYSANSFITDSAPAGTALATGYKTDNGVIGVDPSKTQRFTTIAEAAKQAGMKVGVVSSVSINHATPGSYYAHMPSRNSYYEIGEQLIASGFDYFGGGGLHKYNAKDAAGTPRKSLYAIAAEKGMRVLRDKNAILAAKPGSPVLAVNPVLDASNAMPYALDKTENELSLAEFTAKGIELLDNPKGFFLAVEGGKIDWACHANDAAASIHDTLAFDSAVQVALDFAQKHPTETLVVITGDHETGGMSLGFAGTEYATFFEKIAKQNQSYEGFDKKIADLRKEKGTAATLADIKGAITTSFGLQFATPEAFTALVESAKTDKAAKTQLGLTLTATEQAMVESALALSMKGGWAEKPGSQEYLLYGGYDPLSVQLTHILNNKAGIGWTSYAHTGIPVPVFAQGPGSELFRGYYDNTDIAKKLFSIMGLAFPAPTAYNASK
ncbi:alkaline phosphatase [Desulfovibrio cuneatus]|uniref:alkaline phosphatase n=1 Tax=Desulfovibrio cuneatus TaxID=159728 RepID=UPI00041B75DC|nr:alkaline phosphatase [Desulfovibrio cuneatus]